jgi:Transglycosylase
MVKPDMRFWMARGSTPLRTLDVSCSPLMLNEGIYDRARQPARRRPQTREEVAAVAETSHRWHRWRRRAGWGLAALVVAPILGVAALWPFTPSVDGANQLVRAQLATHHDAELAVLPSPDRVAQALIATEDSRFYSTPGIDPVSVVRVGLAALSGSSDTGAATLEQQLAKNLYFPQDDGVVSKVQEGELALKLDASYSKNDVLRLYLADVYFGHGFYGLPAAAVGYFGMTPAQLSWPQASMLAGLVQAPSAYDPLSHLSTGRLRQRHVLNRLVATGVLSVAQADAAFAAPLGLR